MNSRSGIFSAISASKDPRYLLRKLDPDRYYPVYGDDSTMVEDAPTYGKFYVRLERGNSHILWGNFQTQWTGSELTQFSRALYGAQLLLNTSSITQYGEKRAALSAFASEPGTLQSRDEFRGTGGSLYYLRHMDITPVRSGYGWRSGTRIQASCWSAGSWCRPRTMMSTTSRVDCC